MSAASNKLMDIVICMPDGWHSWPRYYRGASEEERSRVPGPGQIVMNRLSEETREILRGLKSDDIRNVYVPGCGAIGPDVKSNWYSPIIAGFFLSREQQHRQSYHDENRKLLEKFDREVLFRNRRYRAERGYIP